MGRWGVSIVLSVFTSTAFATFTPQKVGTFNALMRNVSVTTTYERNPQTGSYERKSFLIRGNHELNISHLWTKETSSVMADREDVPDIVGKEVPQMQVYRRGNYSELQWYMTQYNPQTNQATPVVVRREIRLLDGATWLDYEQGKSVRAVMAVTQLDSNDSQTIFRSLTDHYYSSFYLPFIKQQQLEASTNVRILEQQLLPSVVLLNLKKIAVINLARLISVEADIFATRR